MRKVVLDRPDTIWGDPARRPFWAHQTFSLYTTQYNMLLAHNWTQFQRKMFAKFPVTFFYIFAFVIFVKILIRAILTMRRLAKMQKTAENGRSGREWGRWVFPSFSEFRFCFRFPSVRPFRIWTIRWSNSPKSVARSRASECQSERESHSAESEKILKREANWSRRIKRIREGIFPQRHVPSAGKQFRAHGEHNHCLFVGYRQNLFTYSIEPVNADCGMRRHRNVP